MLQAKINRGERITPVVIDTEILSESNRSEN